MDGGRSSSSSSSKAPPSGRRTVMSSVRRPSSANAAKAPGREGSPLCADAHSYIYFTVLLSSLIENLPLLQLFSSVLILHELKWHLFCCWHLSSKMLKCWIPSTKSCAFLKGKEAGAGAVDEEDFIKAFEDVPSVQVHQVQCYQQDAVKNSLF